MKFTLTVRRKLSVTEFTQPEPVSTVSPDGSFEADSITFARTAANGLIRQWTESTGVKLRTQKDWSKNLKTKRFEKQIMVQNGTAPETYIFTIEE